MSVLTKSDSLTYGKVVKYSYDECNQQVRFLLRAKFGTYTIVEEYLGEAHSLVTGIGCFARASNALEAWVREYQEYRQGLDKAHNVHTVTKGY